MENKKLLEQIEGNIRTYEKALKNNPLTEEEKKECLDKIEEFKKMKENLRK